MARSTIAQASVDQTGRTITLLIIALLLIAALLTLLTIWFWRHTDPRRRSRRPIPAEMPAPAPLTTSAGARPAEQTITPVRPEEGMSTDEWLSLTGPEPSPRRQASG